MTIVGKVYLKISMGFNNVPIVVTNPIVKEMAKEYHISPRQSASLLDTFSCIIQGFLPYGAQMLILMSVASGMGHALNAFQLNYKKILGDVADGLFTF